MAHVGVEHRHQVQRLDHVRAVLAGQREISLEAELAFQRADLFDHFDTGLGRVAADLQQRQHQRGKFVAHGDAGEAQADAVAIEGSPRAVQRERGTTGVGTVRAEGNEVRQAGDFHQQVVQFAGLRTVVEGSNDLDRLGDPLQVGFQLRFKRGVQHTGDSFFKTRIQKRPGEVARALDGAVGTSALAAAYRPRYGHDLRSCLRGPATAPEWLRLLSTWPGTLRQGERQRTEQP
ncbi:hypothetical protein D9M73_136420 [compost metagenome]